MVDVLPYLLTPILLSSPLLTKLVDHKFNTASDNNQKHISYHPYHDMDVKTECELRRVYKPFNAALADLLKRPLPLSWAASDRC